MKKNRFFWASAAIAALTLTACADQDEFNQNDVQTAAIENSPGAIQFGTYLGENVTTRAEITQTYQKGTIGNKTDAVLGLTELKAAQFGVFGYFTGATDYRTSVDAWGTGTWKATETNKYPNFFFNQKVYFDDATGKNAWVYDPVKYWPNGIDLANDDTKPNVDNTPSNTAIQKEAGKLSFFAFAPYMAIGSTTALVGTVPFTPATVTANDVATPLQIDLGSGNVNNGVVAISNNASPTDVWVRYLLPSANANDAVDLLWGLSGKNAYRETDAVNPAKTIGSDYNENLTKQIVSDRVKFLFKHALAKLGGSTSNGAESLVGNPLKCGLKVVADVDYNSGQPKVDGQSKQGSDYFPTDFNRAKTLITLKEVKIQDGNSINNDTDLDWITGMTGKLLNHGWFDIETGKWCEDNDTYGADGNGAVYNVKAINSDKDLTDNTYSINAEIREPDSETEVNAIVKTGTKDEWVGDNTMNKPKGVDIGTPKPVFANENVPALVFIPTGKNDGSVKQTIYVTVDYFVRTVDPNLNKGYSQVEQIITNEVILDGVNLDPNKYYTLIMHLGMTSVKFEAVVTDWASNTGDEFNEDGSITEQGDENAEVVWLPSNVVNQNVLATLEKKASEPANYFSNKEGQTKVLTFMYNGTEITDYDHLTVSAGLPSWLSYDAASHTFTTVGAGTADNQSTTVTMQYVHTADGKTSTIKQDINVVRYGTNGLVVTATPGIGPDGKLSAAGDVVTLSAKLRGETVIIPTDGATFTADSPEWLTWNGTAKTLTATGNTAAERTKTVTVSYSDGVYGDYTATIDITQAAAQLEANSDNFTMGVDAGSKSAELTVTFNGTPVTNDIEVVIPASVSAWLQYDTVNHWFVALTKNTTGAARPTTPVDVTIKYNGLTITVKVQQLNS